jgi:hypothetical protein
MPRILVDSIYKKPFVFLQNGWFLTKSEQVSNEIIVSLIKIRSDYGFENDIIRNGFVKDFGIPESTGFSRIKDASEYQVFSGDGTFLFSLLYPEIKGKTYLIHIPLLLWGLAFLVVLLATLYLVNYLVNHNQRIAAIIACFLIFSLIYLLVLIAGKPGVLLQTQLFSPYRYTMNAFIPSLGHLLLLSILLSVLSYVFFSKINISKLSGSTVKTSWLTLSLLLIPGALLFSLYHIVFSHLVFNSNINFETYKVLDLNIFSLTGFVTILLFFSVPFLYVLKVFIRYYFQRIRWF